MSDIEIKGNDLFERVVFILEQARANIAKSVNNNMVIAYWLIGREIVQELQKGKERAEYGERVVKNLSKQLTKRYDRGFSITNIKYFRQFYLVYSERTPEIRHFGSGQSDDDEKGHFGSGLLGDMSLAIEKKDKIDGFSPFLSWTHYRTLMRVENENERLFYEIEAEKDRWDVDHLKRQINTFLFARLLKSKDKEGVMALARDGLNPANPADIIKNPYILDFLGLPESEKIHETAFEQAIINNLQSFLLELGKGFAFVARQKRVSTETREFYIDLVFYNFYLKCFVLIDLKTGELTHQDVGQMDMYVRMFDDLERGEGDNPTIGLILCSDKDKTIVKYSVLNESRQLFASKYKLYLPTEEELIRELEKEKRFIEAELGEVE